MYISDSNLKSIVRFWFNGRNNESVSLIIPFPIPKRNLSCFNSRRLHCLQRTFVLKFFFSLQPFSHTSYYIVRVNAESQNYRYESIQTTAGIIDPNEICIAMIDGNLSILVHLLDFCLFLSSSNNSLSERNAIFFVIRVVREKDYWTAPIIHGLLCVWMELL